MTTEEATISNKWEMVAIVELLEQRGLCTKQDHHAIIDELRRRTLVPESLRWLFLSPISSPKPRTRSLTTFSNCSTE